MGSKRAKRRGRKSKGESAKREKVDLNKPIVVMTPAEQEYADSVIREHFDEDRTEIVSNVRFDARLLHIRNHSRQNVVSNVSDELIYGLKLFTTGRASGDNDSGRPSSVWKRSQCMLLNFLLKIRQQFFPRHGSSEEEREL
jgi:hypothetical protein